MVTPQIQQLINKKFAPVAELAQEICKDLNLPEDYEAACYMCFLDDAELKSFENNEEFSSALEIVASLKKIDSAGDSAEKTNTENIRKMFFAISKDISVVFLKLSLTLARLEKFPFATAAERKDFASDCLSIYAPLAARLGLSKIKSNLEDRAFFILHKAEYLKIEEEVNARYKKREETVENLKKLLANCATDLNLNVKIMGRKKHIYSIYKKLLVKNWDFDDIYDLVAVRAITESVGDCYALLGKIHSKATPMPSRFKDYIAIPKSNGYMSLHTTVIFQQVAVEVQIRTQEMHRFAEYGLAAHWLYKEKRKSQDDLDKKLGWLRELIDKGENLTKEEMLSALKVDIYNGEIFVQSPKGKVVHLPEGATPIDFAYAIHSEVGNKCVGTKINGKLVKSSTKLSNGDVVEIITNPNSKGPSLDWLKTCKTSEAKSKINSFFKKIMKDDNEKLGKNILELAIKDRGYAPSRMLCGEMYERVIKRYNFRTESELLCAIGYGTLSAKVVANTLEYNFKKQENQIRKKETKTTDAAAPTKSLDISIEGEQGLALSFAGCCCPKENDEIVAFLSVGRGIIIHKKDCPHVECFDKNRLLAANWVQNNN